MKRPRYSLPRTNRELRWCLIAAIAALIWLVGSSKMDAQVSYPHVQHAVSDVFFLDSLHGWVVAGGRDGSVLFRTNDGGDHWTMMDSRKDLFRVFFLDSRLGWALTVDSPKVDAPRTSLYETRDGGQTWAWCSVVIASKPGHPEIILDFTFVDSKRGLFVGQAADASGLALETHDGGKSIHSIRAIAGKEPLYRISAPAKNKVWMFGKNTIVASFDGGHTWKYQIDSEHMVDNWESLMLDAGLVQDSGRGWAAGAAPVILTTKDFGRSWRIVFERKDHWFHDIAFWDGDHGCAVGQSTFIDCTSDGGSTWTSKNVLPHRELQGNDVFTRVLLSSSSRWWVLEQGGFLFRSDDGGSTWKEINFDRTLAQEESHSF